jgi:hypothetical protein
MASLHYALPGYHAMLLILGLSNASAYWVRDLHGRPGGDLVLVQTVEIVKVVCLR